MLSLGTAGESISTANIDSLHSFRRLYSRNMPEVTREQWTRAAVYLPDDRPSLMIRAWTMLDTFVLA